MIQSMTGYGKATVTFGEKKIHVELKSLNSKAMDLSVRIAPLYREKEMEIRTQITKALERGKVDFSLWVEKEATEMATPINAALMSNYYEQIKNITATTDIPMPADLFATLLRMPDVLTKVDIQELTEEEWNVVRQGIDEAIAQITIRNGARDQDPRKDYRCPRKDYQCGLRQEPSRAGIDLLHRKARHQRRKATPQQSPRLLPRNHGHRSRTRQEARIHCSGNGTRNQHHRKQVEPC